MRRMLTCSARDKKLLARLILRTLKLLIRA